MIHLGVDARDIFASQPRGVGKALIELFRHLLPLIPNWAVTLYTNRNSPIELPPPAQIKQIDIRGDRFDAWERLRLPIAAMADRIDLLHCPSQTAPPLTSCPVVLTVHDLIPLRMDDGWNPGEVIRFRRILSRAVAKARRIITVSEFTRRDLVSEFRASENKIDVVPWGVHENASDDLSDEEWKALCQTWGLRPPFFVAFGGEAPRKNVPRILEALNLFVREINADIQLLLLGVPPSARGKFTAIAESLNMSRNVIQIGYVTDSTVVKLLARSEALVYASIYEGFGLPILEAMAAGSPVITSSVTSMPEIAGDAALLVDPSDPYSIKDAMQTCYLNEPIKAGMRQKGLERIKRFTWKQSAELTFATYERAFAST